MIWFCDLRDFTGHSERLGIVGVTDLVNDFFDAVARSVTTHGGEILKFIGDAALAIFPIADPTQTPAVCAQALAAMAGCRRQCRACTPADARRSLW